MERTLLKRAAMQSVTLMFIVIALSYYFSKYQVIESSNLKDNLSLLPDSLEEVVDHNQTQEDNILNDLLEDKELQEPMTSKIEGLSDRYLMIEKPEGENISFHIEDLFLSKSVKINIRNLSYEVATNHIVGRVNKEEFFSGDPVKNNLNVNLPGNETDQELKYGNDIVHNITIQTVYEEVTKTYSAELLVELNDYYDLEIIEDEAYYIINLRKPREVYDKIIVIDAGHGGKDAGAIALDDKLYEKEVNLSILLELKKLLDQDNIKVYYTRTTDEQIYLRPRVELANGVDADFFISIHSNASVDNKPKGTEIYYYNYNLKNVSIKAMASLFLEEVMKMIPLVERGIVERRNDEIYILENATVPAILLELGYLTNYNDMIYLRSKENHKVIARGIYNGIHRAYQEFYQD